MTLAKRINVVNRLQLGLPPARSPCVNSMVAGLLSTNWLLPMSSTTQRSIRSGLPAIEEVVEQPVVPTGIAIETNIPIYTFSCGRFRRRIRPRSLQG